MSVSKKGSKHYRILRRNQLMAMLDKIGDAKMHAGAGNAGDYVFSFSDAYNNERLVEKVGRKRTKGEVRLKSEIEVEEAQSLFVGGGCKNCEFFPCLLEPEELVLPEAKELFRTRRRKLFWDIFDNPKVSKRMRERLAHPDMADGKKSAACAVLIRAGRLKGKGFDFWTY